MASCGLTWPHMTREAPFRPQASRTPSQPLFPASQRGQNVQVAMWYLQEMAHVPGPVCRLSLGDARKPPLNPTTVDYNPLSSGPVSSMFHSLFLNYRSRQF